MHAKIYWNRLKLKNACVGYDNSVSGKKLGKVCVCHIEIMNGMYEHYN